MTARDATRKGGIECGLVISAFLVSLLASSPGNAQETNILQKFGEWTAYLHSSPDKKVCFVTSKPKRKRPKKVRRDPIFFYVSHWPADKVHNEVNIKIGYPFRKGTKAEVTIGKAKFKLFTKGEGAWAENVGQEKKLIEAMKKGNLMIVKGRSKRGTRTTDDYSLSGLSDALARIDEECVEAPKE